MNYKGILSSSKACFRPRRFERYPDWGATRNRRFNSVLYERPNSKLELVVSQAFLRWQTDLPAQHRSTLEAICEGGGSGAVWPARGSPPQQGAEPAEGRYHSMCIQLSRPGVAKFVAALPVA